MSKVEIRLEPKAREPMFGEPDKEEADDTMDTDTALAEEFASAVSDGDGPRILEAFRGLYDICRRSGSEE